MKLIALPFFLFIFFSFQIDLPAQESTGITIKADSINNKLFVPPSAENIFDAKNSMLYARYLLKNGQYDAASNELERISFMTPGDDTAKFLLIESYKKAGNFSEGLKKTEVFFPDNSQMPAPYSVSYSQMLLQKKDYDKLSSFTSANHSLSEKDKFFFRLNTYLFKKEWKQAKIFWNSSDSSYKSFFPTYDQLIEDAASQKYKKVALATGMSVLLPGSGKFYTKDWVDGILSFVTIGALSFQAYRGFSAKGTSSTYGWIFGTLAFGFYSGNIYGSFKAAKKYNTVLDEKNLYDVEKAFRNSY